jgi:hypothetical protein
MAYEDLADTQGRAAPAPAPATLKRALGRAASALRDHLRRLGAAALDLVFPPTCLACRKATAGHDALCPACWSRINFIDRPYCERLGTPFPYDLGIEGLNSPTRSPILPSMRAPVPWRGSRRGRCAPSCTV